MIKKIIHIFLKELRSEKGFTLIELFISLAILTGALLGVANFIHTVIRANAFSEKMTLAVTRSQEKIEDFKNTGYSSLSKTPGSDTPDSGLTRSWTVTDHSPASNMASVVVTVSWTSLYGKSHRVILRTIISQ